MPLAVDLSQSATAGKSGLFWWVLGPQGTFGRGCVLGSFLCTYVSKLFELITARDFGRTEDTGTVGGDTRTTEYVGFSTRLTEVWELFQSLTRRLLSRSQWDQTNVPGTQWAGETLQNCVGGTVKQHKPGSRAIQFSISPIQCQSVLIEADGNWA